MSDLDPLAVSKALFTGAAKFIGTMAVIIGGLTASYEYFVKPGLEELIRDEIRASIREEQVSFIEIPQRGVTISEGPFRPGGTSPIEFLVKRNLPCATAVSVQFYSARQGRILTAFTYEIPATQASPSFVPAPFVVDVRIPEGLPDGRYSYRAILRPDRLECPGQKDVTAYSDFFNVRKQ